MCQLVCLSYIIGCVVCLSYIILCYVMLCYDLNEYSFELTFTS